MKRARSGNGVGGKTVVEKSPSTTRRVASRSPYRIRRSEPKDLNQIQRLDYLLEEAGRSGELISSRPREFYEDAVRQRRAVMAFRGNLLVGFALAHPWQDNRFVSHTAMVVAPAFRGRGIARKIKAELIRLSRRSWPDASIISLTLSSEVERLNKSLGYQPVPYCDLTTSAGFWEGCKGCIHHAHLKRNQLQDCHCWAGLLPPPGQTLEKVIPKDALRRPDNDSFYSQ